MKRQLGFIFQRSLIALIPGISDTDTVIVVRHSGNYTREWSFFHPCGGHIKSTETLAMASGPSVAVIGGGIAGLVCAARLGQLGINNVRVFDTGKNGPGGRCSSRNIVIDGQMCTFDHSAQYFTVSDPRFAKIVSFLQRQGAVKIWNGKIGHLNLGHFTQDKPDVQAFVGMEGMQTVPKCLAGLVNVTQSVWVSSVFWEGETKKWHVDKYGYFDYLVIAHNGKCADKLMSNAGVPHIHKLLQVRFSDRLNLKDKRMHLCSIWALLVCFPRTLGLPYEGAHVTDYDISWIANNTAKLQKKPKSDHPQGTSECWTVFSTREFGAKNKVPQENIPKPKQKEVTDKLLEGLKRVTGLKELPVPGFTKVQLWGAGVPLNVLASKDECIFDSLCQVGVCGDWLTRPCIEGAAVSGLALAEKIGRHFKGEDRSSTTMVQDFRPADGEVIGAFPSNPYLVFTGNPGR